MWQVIMEQLVNGTNTSVISPNIVAVVSVFVSLIQIDQLPSISTCKKARTVLLNTKEMMAAHVLVKADE